MIKRHSFNDKMISLNVSYFRDKIDDLKLGLTNNPKASGSIFGQGISAIGDSVVSEETKEDVLKLIDITKELGLNNFRNAQQSGKVNFTILKEELSVNATSHMGYADPIFWSKCFYVAVLAEDKAAIDELLTIEENFMRKAQLKCNEVDFAIVRFLKALYQPDTDLGEALADAMKQTDPKLYKSRASYLLNLKFPELNLYRLAFSNKNDEFNVALKEALTQHKKFWGAKKNMNASEGWISLPLLVACKIAHISKGYKITTESEYIPIELYR